MAEKDIARSFLFFLLCVEVLRNIDFVLFSGTDPAGWNPDPDLCTCYFNRFAGHPSSFSQYCCKQRQAVRPGISGQITPLFLSIPGPRPCTNIQICPQNVDSSRAISGGTALRRPCAGRVVCPQPAFRILPLPGGKVSDTDMQVYPGRGSCRSGNSNFRAALHRLSLSHSNTCQMKICNGYISLRIFDIDIVPRPSGLIPGPVYDAAF